MKASLKTPIILWVFCWLGLLSPPSIIHSWVLNMVRLHGNGLFTTNYYYDVCLWMKITFFFSCFLFYEAIARSNPCTCKMKALVFSGICRYITYKYLYLNEIFWNHLSSLMPTVACCHKWTVTWQQHILWEKPNSLITPQYTRKGQYCEFLSRTSIH